jgi:hypothetical protein
MRKIAYRIQNSELSGALRCQERIGGSGPRPSSHATLETVAHNLDRLIDQFPMTAIVANRYQDVGRQSDCARNVTRVRARRELPPVRLLERCIFRCGIGLVTEASSNGAVVLAVACAERRWSAPRRVFDSSRVLFVTNASRGQPCDAR